MDLKFIYTDKNFIELGYLKRATLDIDIGKYGLSENDFELTLSIDNIDYRFDDGSLFYAEDTEWGGMLTHKRVSTGEGIIIFKGKTFRGMLEKEYIQPSDDSETVVLSGDANEIIKELIDGRFGDLFVVDEEASGIDIAYDVRDLNLLEALEKALGSANAKLDIKHRADGKVHLKAVKIVDMSDELQYDNNYNLSMNVETRATEYNHLIALGKGTGTSQLRVNMYMQEDGTWDYTERFSGLLRKTFMHENINVEDELELTIEALDKVMEENMTESLDVLFSSDDADLFDVVGAWERITNIAFKQPITQKILRGDVGDLSVEYKIGEYL